MAADMLRREVDPRRAKFLSIVAALAIAAGWFLSTQSIDPPAAPPVDASAFREVLRQSPSDRQILSQIAENAFDLDLDLQRSEATWRVAGQALRTVAPAWQGGRVRVVRAGLFHWPELSENGRQYLLKEATTLLPDRLYFEELSLPLYRLTGRIDLLLANSPPTPEAFDRLLQLTLAAGKFEQYSTIRAKAPAHYRRVLADVTSSSASAERVVRALLLMPRIPSMEPVAREYLRALAHVPSQTVTVDQAALGEFLTWSRHRNIGPIEPLYRLATVDPAMDPVLLARLALHSGEIEAAQAIALRAGATGSREWAPFHLAVAEEALARNDRGAALAAFSNVPEAARDSLAALNVRIKAAELAGQQELAQALFLERSTRYGAASADSRWDGICEGRRLCHTRASLTLSSENGLLTELDLAPAGEYSVPAWVEVRVNQQLAAEVALRGRENVAVTLPAGMATIEVILKNPITGTGSRRAITLRSAFSAPRPARVESATQLRRSRQR